MLELILDVKKRGLPIILISHNMPHVFEVSDRIRLHVVGLDVIAEHFDYIAREVLAVRVVMTPSDGAGPGTAITLDDGETSRQATIWIEKS